MPWTLFASGILGLGIGLGGYWAYETLGWGGSPPGESFAEMITEYISSKEYNHPRRSWSGYPGGPWVNPGSGWTTFEKDRPLHFKFAKDQILQLYLN